MKQTTTIRISLKTQEILKKLSKEKQMTMSSIVYNLAENELKRVYEINKILK